MPKKRIGYFILLATIALVYIMSNSYFALSLLLFTIAAPCISLLLLLYTARQINLELRAPVVILPEGPKSISYIIKNGSPLPAPHVEWVASIKTHLTGRKTDLIISAFCRGSSTEEIPFSLASLCAGKLVISTRAARVYDLFGLFHKRFNPPKEQLCLVYPRLARFNINIHNRVESDEGSIYSQYKPGSDPTEIFALHEYVQGDDLRKVHWKLSAKTDNLIVRDFGLPLDYPVALLLETQNTGDEADEQSLSCCLEVFISLSLSFLQHGVSHNIAWYDDGRFHTGQISSIEELETFIPVLLAVQGYQEPCLALDCYANSSFARRSMAIYYVTAHRNTAAISEALPGQTVITILVKAKEKHVTDINTAEAETVLVAADNFGQLVVNL